jgi:membrane-associated phospholipid phosphatase
MRWLFIPHLLSKNILPAAFLSFISIPLAAYADADLSSAPTVTADLPPSANGIRPVHLWTTDYLDLLWNDTGAVITAPARWDQDDWLIAGFSFAGIGAAASLDKPVKNRVQAHRTAGENRFFGQYQKFGDTWSFGVIGAFEVWGEADGDSTAKNAAMDALTASIIGPGLIGTSVKYAVGRVRPNTATSTFEFKPFSGNQSFPSGHASQAFAVATSIAENYPSWWVQALCYGGAGLVGYARIEQNAHYTSDVVAGALLGWAVARAVVNRHDRTPDPDKLSWAPYANGSGYGLVFFKSF